ncbi:MAG: type II secretion system inner membrane protein GspF [Pseudomonadales bacterium]|nr:type II secretion system inner membrane protein GspF [Pseudomonadales bacterium]MDP6473036.1 type II secretion system inner membrane protein GspF [Pseudomonadales bacterium]MDP6826207.1 type II secretion system inner membrane protein GspF [Pseudomonadales bacterium]
MAAFEYIALDERGKRRKGVLEADSIRQIRQMLRDQGLVPLDVDVAAQPKITTARSSRFQLSRGLGGLDRVLITRQLATLVAAGLPIEEALGAVAQQSEKQPVNALVMGIRSRVLEGHSLASSLGEFPLSFNDMYRSTVAAGEQSGHLDKVLENLAQYTERQYEASRDVSLALFYPIMLFLLAIGIVGVLMVYVVPDMVAVLENMDQELPFSTRILIGFSEFAQEFWWAIILGVTAVVLGVRWLLNQPNIRLNWDRQKLSMPLVQRIARSNSAARYANTLSILTSSGVPVVEAMNIASDVVSNTWLRRRLADATQRVSEGSSMRAALETVGYFPPMVLYMVASGEASGKLDTMLDRVAAYQQADVERIVTTLVRMFEPLMLVSMGLLVTFIVMAILLPILNMNQLV